MNFSIWIDILTMHYQPNKTEGIIASYANHRAFMKMSVTKFSILKRFDAVNKDRPPEKLVKPYKFFLIGSGCKPRPGSDELVYPMVEYVDPNNEEIDQVPYMSFPDYKTGDYYKNTEHPDTHLYW